jgi:2-polyprenyl-3-methyl-5-hydroxy-6-metoxy-1,4-benzoquinol methylase
MAVVSTREMIDFLKNRNHNVNGLVTNMKISYRPVICPFDDLLNDLPENESVFDIGCGSGMFLSLVKEFKSPRMLAGVEIDEVLIDNARQILDVNGNVEVNLSPYDGHNFPDSIKECKYVYLIDVLHHVPKAERSRFFRNIYEKMSVGSVLVIKDINAKSILSYWNKFHDLLLAGEIGSEPDPTLLKTELEKLGFAVSPISFRRMLLYPHFTIYCTK